MDQGADELRYQKSHSHNGSGERKTLNMDTQSANDIQREIERTRAEMNQTICEIQSRLSTDKLMDQAMDSVRVAVREGTPRLLDAVRRNPIPLSLVALGVGWLIFRQMKKDSVAAGRHYGGSPMESDLADATPGVYYEGRGIVQQGKERIKQTAAHLMESTKGKAAHLSSQAKDKVTGMAGHLAEQAMAKTAELASQAKEKTMGIVSQAREKTTELACGLMDKTGHAASSLAHQAREQAGQLGTAALEQSRRMGTAAVDQARHQGRRANDQFWHQVDGNPMAVGAIVLAVGAAIGLCLPETRKENELLGPARDNLLNRAKETGRETLEKVQHAATTAQQAITEELENHNLTAKLQGSGSDHSQGKSKSPAGDDLSTGQQEGNI